VTAVFKALGMNQHHVGLQQVMALKANGDPTRIMHIMKEDLEVACLNKAQRRFTQAATTPMLQEPLLLLLGNTTLKSAAFQQVLEGMFQCPESCDIYTKKVLKQLARPPQGTEILGRTFEEYRWGWAIAHKTTASSPSSLHFGHYIVALANTAVAKINAILAIIT